VIIINTYIMFNLKMHDGSLMILMARFKTISAQRTRGVFD